MIEQSNTPADGRSEHSAFMAWIERACATSPRALVAVPARMAWLGALEWAGLTQPLALTLNRTLGMQGEAFDGPGPHRAYTYEQQPGNTGAYRLGVAANATARRPAGDSIDRGLALLQELQAVGFGVFQIEPSDAAPRSSDQHFPPAADGWTRSAETPPPVGVPVVLFTPGHDIEEFVNDGPDAYPDWSNALSWWVLLPAHAEYRRNSSVLGVDKGAP